MRILPAIILVATLCVVAACSRQSSDLYVDDRVSAAYAEALAEPQDRDKWLDLGRHCLDLWQETRDPYLSDLADSALTHAVRLDSTNVATWEQFARLRTAQHRFDEAITVVTNALRKYGAGAEVWGLMGDAHLGVGNYRNADSSYYVMYELDSGFESLRRVARVTITLRDYADAVGYLDRAIANAATWHVDERALANAYVQRGEIFFAYGALDAALRDAQDALARSPQSVGALSLRARIHSIAGRAVQATRDYERVATLSQYPRYMTSFAAHLRAYGYDARADSLVGVAAKSYRRLSERYPQVVERDYVEFMLQWRGDAAEALRLAREDTRHRKDTEGYALLALAYYKNEQYDNAWSSISMALRQGGRHPMLLHRAAVIAKAAGKTEKYKTFATRAREANPFIEEIYGPF